tara:strand:+ start:847 stop:2175 length:1329 start_codon:yes stop_codon:yes gene_type:complete
MTKINPDDVDFMKPIAAANFRKEERFAPILLYATGLFIVIFILWANYAEIDELTRAEGRVIPSSQIQRVDHLEGGIVQDIYIREGDIVEKGQVLLKIDNTQASARLQEGENLYYRYLSEVGRLRAQINQIPYVVPEEVSKKAPVVAERAMARYRARMGQYNNQLNIAKQEVEQKKQELLELENRKSQLKDQVALSEEEVKINEPLVKRGLTARVDFLRLKSEAVKLRGELGSVKVNIERARSALKQAKDKLKQVPLDFAEQDSKALQEAENKLGAAQESFKTEGDRLSRTEVKSPVKGIVKQLLVATIGGVVQPGEDLVEIVPLEDTLLIEAKVLPADIAFLRPGLPASIKLTAYDFAIYGGLEAELVQISADSIQDEKDPNISYFKIRLRTLGNRLSKSSKEVAIIPGMTASADIITGKKTILDYILKPILRARQNALTER